MADYAEDVTRAAADLPQPLVLGAGKDALIAPLGARGTANLLGAAYRQIPDLGHAVMLDAGWESAAQAILGWLEEIGL